MVYLFAYPVLQLRVFQSVVQRVFVYQRHRVGYLRMLMSRTPLVDAHPFRSDDGRSLQVSRVVQLFVQVPKLQHHVLRNVLRIVLCKAETLGYCYGCCPHLAGLICKLFLCHYTNITNNFSKIKQEIAFFFIGNN